jgi:protein-tyrosine-phosphatase
VTAPLTPGEHAERIREPLLRAGVYTADEGTSSWVEGDALASLDALLALLADAEQRAKHATDEKDRTISVVLAVHAEATTQLMRRFIEGWKDGRVSDLTEADVRAAIDAAIPEAVRRGIPDPSELRERLEAAEARVAELEAALRRISAIHPQDHAYVESGEIARAALAQDVAPAEDRTPAPGPAGGAEGAVTPDAAGAA